MQAETKVASTPTQTFPMTGVLQRKCECGQHMIAGGACASCQDQQPSLQRATRSVELEKQNSEGAPPMTNEVLLSPGRPLDANTRAFEPRFGHDFSRIRVRTDGQLPAFRPSRLDSRLSAQTPAWSDKGEIYVGAAGLLMPSLEREQMLRHEMVHAFHQRVAAVNNNSESRRHAEELAVRGEHHPSGLALADFLNPAPVLLAYPPQTYSPWSKVWIGYPGLLGEIVEAGVTVRIFMSYDELGLKKSPKYQAYECDKHDIPPMADVVKKMKSVAQIAAEMNKKLPTTATAQRVALIAIYGDHTDSAYRSAGGQGFIVLGRDEFDAGTFESTITHESSHAVFEYHSVAASADVSARVPDPLALRIGDLYLQLWATKEVPLPKAKFDKKSPPSLIVKKDGNDYAAGIVMVMDTLWAGSGGHPWQGVDEFFASAYAAFLRERALLDDIIKFYEKHDPAIKPLAAELLTLLATVSDPKKYGKLKEPGTPAAAQKTLGAVSAPTVFTKEHRTAGWFIDPSRMPAPEKINCSAKLTSQEDIDKILEGEQQPEKPAKQPASRPDKEPERR